jgi:hypothetical protein
VVDVNLICSCTCTLLVEECSFKCMSSFVLTIRDLKASLVEGLVLENFGLHDYVP